MKKGLAILGPGNGALARGLGHADVYSITASIVSGALPSNRIIHEHEHEQRLPRQASPRNQAAQRQRALMRPALSIRSKQANGFFQRATFSEQRAGNGEPPVKALSN